MAQKFLHELLKEDQEPFFLNKYISDRRSQIRRPSLQLVKNKHKPIHQNSNFSFNLCKKTCLFSFPDTPDLRKSPLFEFTSSPAIKSPCNKSPNTIFLHIPSRTASLLLEASIRIQKQSSSNSKTQNKGNGFGLLGSFFKRLTKRNQNRKREIEGSGGKVSVKDILRWDSSVGRKKKLSNGKNREQEKKNKMDNENVCEVGFQCSSYNGRPSSSAVWSETNEDKSLDMETSISSGSLSDDDDENSVTTHQKHSTCCHDINRFCESPFRFVLERSPSSGRQTPELASPAPSPPHHRTQDKEINGSEDLKKFESGEEEEDKEQCSPVSVLDPPFEDDDEGHGNDGFDLESSYAIVQRAKQQLLYKLRRFEKLAELDPVELEKRMLDQEEDEDETVLMEEDDFEDEEDSESSSYKENDFRELVFEALTQSSVHEKRQIPQDLNKLVSDLIMEEERELNCVHDGRDMVMTRVCKRLELWKEVESNTIDMMIEQDFLREESGWKKNAEQIRDVAGEVELAIFGFLVEEFSEELVC